MNVAGTSAKVVVRGAMNVREALPAQRFRPRRYHCEDNEHSCFQAVTTVNGTVGTMSVSGSDATVKAEEGAKIEKITTSAANTSVSGQGSVDKL